jgi:hypothetical protein
MTQSTRCPHCKRALQFQRIHAGFGDFGYMYCDHDEAVVTWDSYDQRCTEVVGEKHPWMLNDEERRGVEAAIKDCPYGGHFSYGNPPRCPHCFGDLPSLAADRPYVVVLGRRLDATTDRLWKSSS